MSGTEPPDHQRHESRRADFYSFKHGKFLSDNSQVSNIHLRLPKSWRKETVNALRLTIEWPS